MKNFKIQKIIIVTFFSICILFLFYLFVYKPYFTVEGKIDRELKEESMLKKKVLYYVCALPESDEYYQKFKKECDDLKSDTRSQDYSPLY